MRMNVFNCGLFICDVFNFVFDFVFNCYVYDVS